ncbi:hypothetical protein [Cupriavidus sp. a3]|uniref:hypothetical protein n=1 Tax=Cupriavidus sp. a3 TaxID=3242158 RepID=UPI003D9C2694
MVEGRVLYLFDEDFNPELIGDDSLPVQYRLKAHVFEASLAAKAIIWGDRVVMNRFGRAGLIHSLDSGGAA